MDNQFNTIRDNLSRCYIYYIPKQYYDYFEKSFLNEYFKPNMTNIVMFANKEREIFTDTRLFKAFELMDKSSILDSNIQVLIKQKESISDIAFKHLLYQYSEHVYTNHFLTSWMSKNLLNYIPTTDAKIRFLFRAQASAFNNHCIKLEQYFGIEENISSPLITQLKNLEKTNYKKEETINKIIEPKPLPVPTKMDVKAKKKKKESIITEKESRNFLLETVFNIDPKYLKQGKPK